MSAENINPFWRIWRADGYRKLEMEEECMRELTSLTDSESKTEIALEVWFEIHLGNEDWESLYETVQLLARFQPTEVKWVTFESFCAFQLFDVWEASKAIVRALPRFPKAVELRLLLHSLHQDAGHGETAEHWLTEAVRIDPQAVSVEETEPDEPSAAVRGEYMGGTGFTLYGDSFQGRRW